LGYVGAVEAQKSRDAGLVDAYLENIKIASSKWGILSAVVVMRQVSVDFLDGKVVAGACHCSLAGCGAEPFATPFGARPGCPP
jgi:hypothetical protein